RATRPRTRTGSRTSPSTCSSRARSGGRRHATSAWRSTASAASSTPSRARSTPATTSGAHPTTASRRWTSSSTCSATRSSSPPRSSARRYRRPPTAPTRWHLGIARSLEDLTLVVARVEIDFRAPVGFPEVVEVGVRAGSFGRKSFGLDHELRVRGELVAEAKTVLVAYDYGKAETVTIPETWREKLAA